MTDTTSSDLRDFISLELKGGYPSLRVNLGDGELTLTVTGKDSSGATKLQPLTDGQWHNIHVIKQGNVGVMFYNISVSFLFIILLQTVLH